jgi:hypothetical protein
MMKLASGSVSGGVKCFSRIIAISDSCGDYHYHSVQREKTDVHAEKNSIRSYSLDLQDMKIVEKRRQSSFNVFHIWFWFLLKEICLVLLDWLIK